MRAQTHHRYGTPDELTWSEVEQPVPGPDDVLIRVGAAALNHADLLILQGTPRLARLAFGLRRPQATILGRDVAGTVEAVGARVRRWKPGDEVFGEVDQRGFAEQVTAPAGHLAARPSSVSTADAATLPVAATTALQALRRGRVGRGSVLINGASGGVGTFAVQIARARGATVTAVCSTRNADLARHLGAGHVIDYTREELTGRYDAVIDLAGSQSLAAMRRLLTPGGVYVAATGNGGPILGPMPRLLGVAVGGSRMKILSARRNTDDLTTLAGMVERGEIKPVIERTYPLAEARTALWHLKREHARGKIVLSP
jgi:NADPH:quinone reductase-like Zn-dependent oxidoreductase